MKSATRKLGNKGELIIPKKMRERKGIDRNTKIEIIETKYGFIIIPITGKLSDLAGMFGTGGIDNIKELDAITHELMAGI